MAKKGGKELIVFTRENGKDEVKLNFNKLKTASLILRAVNHPVRKDMLALIESKKKVTVTDLYVKLRMQQSVASQHLAILRKAGVVVTNREGKFVFYSLNKKRIEDLTLLVAELSK